MRLVIHYKYPIINNTKHVHPIHMYTHPLAYTHNTHVINIYIYI